MQPYCLEPRKQNFDGARCCWSDGPMNNCLMVLTDLGSGLIILQSKFVQSIQSFEKICFYNYYKVFSEGMLSD